jgi:hypothetical protein
VLVAVSALIGWEAATIVRRNASTLTNPDKAYTWVAIAGTVAAGVCIVAVWNLRRVWKGCGAWSAALVSYAFALVALFGLLVVAGLTGLGG